MKRGLLIALALLAGCAAREPQQLPVSPAAERTEAIERARIHTELGASYFARGQHAVALEELNEALRAHSAYGPAYNMLGLLYMELREDRLAAENFERALKIDPNDSDANNNYGWFLCQRGQEAKSLQYFAAAQKNPLYATPDKSLVNAGICARRMGNEGAAEDYFRRALEARAEHPVALFNLADLAYRRGDFVTARNYLTRLMRVSHPGPEALWLAVRVERKLGDRQAELGFAQQLRRRFPNARETQDLLSGAEQ